MARYANLERQSLAELMVALGPDGPTILDGWTTRDLAAHLVLRERRPDAAAGIALRFLHDHSERVRHRIAGMPYPDLIAQVRQPPWYGPTRIPAIDELANALELYIHHEDVRRAQPGWEPRRLAPGLEAVLWKRVPMLTRMALRRFPATVLVEAPGHGSRTGGAGGADVRLTAAPSELALFLFGRQRVARVELSGAAEPVERLRGAKLGI